MQIYDKKVQGQKSVFCAEKSFDVIHLLLLLQYVSTILS